jgi:hypothetical protein
MAGGGGVTRRVGLAADVGGNIWQAQTFVAGRTGALTGSTWWYCRCSPGAAT